MGACTGGVWRRVVCVHPRDDFGRPSIYLSIAVVCFFCETKNCEGFSHFAHEDAHGAMVFSMQCAQSPSTHRPSPLVQRSAPVSWQTAPCLRFLRRHAERNTNSGPTGRDEYTPRMLSRNNLSAARRTPAKEVERLDAEIVFLTCPALSEGAGRNLPRQRVLKGILQPRRGGRPQCQ